MKKLRVGIQARDDYAYEEADCLLTSTNPMNSNVQSANNAPNPNPNPNPDQVVEEDKVEVEAAVVADNQEENQVFINTGIDQQREPNNIGKLSNKSHGVTKG